jgi:hypothetical protein
MYMVSNGTIWRPFGGSQVLAMRANNPVTVQNLSGAVAETIGPFPGGVVRAGMRLCADVEFSHAGYGGGTRAYYLMIGNSVPLTSSASTSWLAYWPPGISAAFADAHNVSLICAINDTSGPHRSGANQTKSFESGSPSNTYHAPNVDFSQPWYAQIVLQSSAETAVNITSASWAAGIATFGTSANHTLAVGDKTVIAGITPSGYNVAAGAIVLSVPTTTSFTVAIASDPGAYTSGGTSSRISNMISRSYVLELIG